LDVEAAADDDERGGGRAADEPSFERRREAEDDEKVGVRGENRCGRRETWETFVHGDVIEY